MRLALLVILATAVVACVPKPVTDPHASGVNQQQWVAVVPRTPSNAFDATLRVLTDSAYPILDARKDAGMIRTGGRKASEVQRGMQQMRSMMGRDYPVRLSVLLLPAGADSTRITLTGEYTIEEINRSAPITTRDGPWQMVAGIGYAILHATGGATFNP